MGLFCCNIRLLPQEASIITDESGWDLKGCAEITEEELISRLCTARPDMRYTDDPKADSGRSYLINDGIELFCETEKDRIQLVALRVCMSWIDTALSECYAVASEINAIMPIRYWIENDEGIALRSEKRFVEDHLALIDDKLRIFRRSYPGLTDVRLLESELWSYTHKHGKRDSDFHRELEEYYPIVQTSQR